MKRRLPYVGGFTLGLVMIVLFVVGFRIEGVPGDIIFALSLLLWPVFAFAVLLLNLSLYREDVSAKNILTKSLFMPLPGAIVMVALLYVIM